MRQCLRLVARNLTSKEIARETGLTPQTVDQYLYLAAGILGASNRREAARRFAELDDGQLNKSQLKPEPLAEAVPLVPPKVAGTSPLRSLLGRLLPPLGGQRHDLTPSQAIFAVLRVAVISAAVAAALIAAAYWFNSILK